MAAATSTVGNPAGWRDVTKRTNEEEHNQAAPRQLPYLQGPGQTLPLVVQPTGPTGQPVTAAGAPGAPAVPTQPMTAQQAQGQLLPSLVQQAQGGFQTPATQATGQLAQQYMQQPVETPEQAQARSALAMEKYDVDRAQALEAARAALAPTIEAGESRGQFLGTTLEAARTRSQLGRQLEQEESERAREQMLSKIGVGLDVGEMQRAGYETGIGALGTALGAVEPTLGREYQAGENALDRMSQMDLLVADGETQLAVTTLKGQIDEGLLLTSQDFEGIMAGLGRAHDLAVQKGDIAGQMDVIRLQGELTTMRDTALNNFNVDMNDRIFEQDKWKQGRVEVMQDKGIDADTATAIASREHSTWKTTYDGELEKNLQAGQNEFTAQQNAGAMAHEVTESSLDRNLTREIEAGRITVAESSLAMETSQFATNDEFRRYALESGYDEADADRIWEAGENAADRAMTMTLDRLGRAGVNTQLLMTQIDNMSDTQAADLIRQVAEESGVTLADVSPEQRTADENAGIATDLKAKLDAGTDLLPSEWSDYIGAAEPIDGMAAVMDTFAEDESPAAGHYRRMARDNYMESLRDQELTGDALASAIEEYVKVVGHGMTTAAAMTRYDEIVSRGLLTGV